MEASCARGAEERVRLPVGSFWIGQLSVVRCKNAPENTGCVSRVGGTGGVAGDRTGAIHSAGCRSRRWLMGDHCWRVTEVHYFFGISEDHTIGGTEENTKARLALALARDVSLAQEARDKNAREGRANDGIRGPGKG
jgi:hypothetical protein